MHFQGSQRLILASAVIIAGINHVIIRCNVHIEPIEHFIGPKQNVRELLSP